MREQGPKRCKSGHGAGQWPWAQSSLHLRGQASAASAGFSCTAINPFCSQARAARLIARFIENTDTALPKLRDLIPKLESPRKMLSNGVFRFVRRQRVLRLEPKLAAPGAHDPGYSHRTSIQDTSVVESLSLSVTLAKSLYL